MRACMDACVRAWMHVCVHASSLRHIFCSSTLSIINDAIVVGVDLCIDAKASAWTCVYLCVHRCVDLIVVVIGDHCECSEQVELLVFLTYMVRDLWAMDMAYAPWPLPTGHEHRLWAMRVA